MRDPRTIAALALVIWAIPCLTITGGLFYRSTMLFQRSYNEGWNAFHAASRFHDGPLYYAPSALITNNYPPLSFVVISWVMHVIPDAVFAGRLAAEIALLGIVALIALILRAITRDDLAVAAGALTFLSYIVINAEANVGIDDPQFLSLAVLLLGFYIKIRLGTGRTADVVAALVMTASLFVKHNDIALPLALGIWLLVFEPRAGLRFITTCAVAGLLGLLAARVAFGPVFISSLLSPRLYSLALGVHQALAWLDPMKSLLMLAAVPIVLFPRDRTALLFGCYIVSAVLVGCIAATGSGTASNSMFQVVIATSLAIGYLLVQVRRAGSMQYAYLRVCIILAAAFATVVTPDLYAAKDVLMLPSWLAVQRQRETENLKAVQFLADQSGPVLCSTPSLCYWAGKSFEVDPFNFGEAVLTRHKPLTDVTNRIDAGYYSTIELFDAWDNAALPPGSRADIWSAIRAAVARGYREVPVNHGASTFWVRKTPGAGG